MHDYDQEGDAQYELFERAFELLPKNFQTLILLRKYHRLTDEEIAAKLGPELPENDPALLNPELFTKRVYRALEALKENVIRLSTQ